MTPLELVAVGLFLVAAWGHGFLTGVPYGSIQPGAEKARVADTPDEDPRRDL